LLGVKEPGRKVEVKKEKGCTSSPPLSFMTWIWITVRFAVEEIFGVGEYVV
jgi:hypothetical protein